ncbi:MAG: M3 family metallopeptidase [Micrococcales bacterium]|nr:M3 family metallopeptidase [Micrococcales bacterium]MCL2666266.1 M3 family metallopeptidase [Micrococcales bacterium]
MADLDLTNPFARPSSLPYGLPDYAAVREEHYRPAVLAGIDEQRAQVEAIATDPAAPTMANTLEALERSGQLLDRAGRAFYNQLSADATPGLEELEEEVAPLLSDLSDAIHLDSRLFARVETLHRQAEAGELVLDEQDAWLLTRVHTDFVLAGVHLDEASKERLRALNAQITTLEATFGRMLLAATNAAAVTITDVDELRGLSDTEIAAAAQAGADHGEPGTWRLELALPTDQPVLAALADRSVRERVYQASVTRGLGGEHDTRATLLELARARAERARLLGFEHHAAAVVADETAGSSQAVHDMLTRLTGPAVANARKEAEELTGALVVDHPGACLEPWDWAYYAQRVRSDKHALDESAVRPYLELDRVLRDGVLYAANQLYGLTFTERPDLPGYADGVRVFEVVDAAGAGRGLFVADYFTRDGKRGGAWMDTLVDQSHLLGQRTVVVNNANVPRPAPGEPALLSWDFVITMFHEFGHALHALLSDVRYPSRSGTSVPRDFVEYPSQVNEMWAWDPQVIASFARHHATGEPIPSAWVDTLLAARADGEGFATTEYLAAAWLDQAWHRLAPEDVPTDVDQVEAFEAQALAKVGAALATVPPRYRTRYFSHIFGGGYSAGYYAYVWSEVLDADTVEWFTENDGLSARNGELFAARVLSLGGSVDPMTAFERFRGRPPRIEPLLTRRRLDKDG